ncbi:MAG: protein kinase family protein [Chlamydiales bacterium]|nr:protein kinase family protein [Chlamydiales bacterium]
MNEMNPSFDPLKLDVRDNTEATPTSRFFGGGRKMVRLVVSENDKMVNLAAARLSEQGFKEAQEKLAHAKGLSIFRLWVPVTIKKDGKEESILINIRSAAKRLGVSKQVVFEAAKSGTFQELLRSFNPVSFQGLKKTMESAGVKVSLEPFSKMCTYIALNRQKLCRPVEGSMVYQPDPSGFVKGFLFCSDGTVFIHCKSNIPGKDFIINADSQEQLVCDVNRGAAVRAKNAFSYFQTTVRDAGIIISSQELLKVYNYIATYEETKLEEAKKSQDHSSYEDCFLNLGMGIQFNTSGEVFVHFNKPERSEAWVAVKFHETKLIKVLTFNSTESDTTKKIADSYRAARESYRNAPNVKASYSRVKDAIQAHIPNITSEEVEKICGYITCNRKEKQKEAASSLEKVSYVKARKPKDNPDHPCRAIQFNADGTVFIHFNKKKLGDRELGRGSYKKVRLALNFDTGEPLAVARLILKSKKYTSATAAVEREFGFLQRFKDSPGIAQATQCVKVDGNVAKMFFIQPIYSRNLNEAIGKDLNPKKEAQIILDLLKGAQELEKKGVIHRDIKPENIFLDAKGDAYIADFGLALDNDRDLQAKGHRAGTAGFYSPEYEHAKKEQLADVTTFKHDMWALGRTIYIMHYARAPNIPIEKPKNSLENGTVRWLLYDLLQNDPSKRLLASEALAKYETLLKRIAEIS